ncbi:hypothetical protein Scep_005663 [Stephania cephalantha]|uniref:Uncharacterized protein n=1 Tax=Stephania cephalantha TaxID=152367 RepID=A0AAP0KXV2_9MAGN
MALARSKVTEAEPVCMTRTKTTRSGENSNAPNSERPSRRAQTTSYRKYKELGRKSKDLDEGSRAQVEDVQGRELSVHKTPTTQPESSSSDSSEEDREQGVEEEDSTEKEIREVSGSEDGDDDSDGDGEGKVKRKKKKKGERRGGYTRTSGQRKNTT